MQSTKSLILALGCSLALASCTDSLNAPGDGQLTPVVANGRAADRIDGDLTSRVNRPIQKVDQDWILGFEWQQSDRVIFADPELPGVIGVIDLESMADDKQSATFKGGLMRNGKNDFRVTTWSLGDRTLSPDLENTVTISLADQTGRAQDLGKYDVLADISDANRLHMTESGLVANFNLTSTLSFVRFILDLPDGVNYTGQAVNVTGQGLASEYTLNLSDGSTTPTDGTITVRGTKLDNGDLDIYMALLPAQTGELTFTTDIDGNRYTGTFTAFTYQPNTYYTKSGTDGGGCTVTTNDPRLNGTWTLYYHCPQGHQTTQITQEVTDGFAPRFYTGNHDWSNACDANHTGATFLGWDLDPAATTVVYQPDTYITPPAKETHIYAVFDKLADEVIYYAPTADSPAFLIARYQAIGGKHVVRQPDDSWYAPIAIPDGKILAGYDTDRQHANVVYTIGQDLDVTGILRLYAVFADKPEEPEPADDETVGPVFTLADGTKVRFTRANLHFNTVTRTWFLPDNQTDFVGLAGELVGNNNTYTPAAGKEVIDHFLWGCTGYNDGSVNVVKPEYWKETANQSSDAITASVPFYGDNTKSYAITSFRNEAQLGQYCDWGYVYALQQGGTKGDYLTLTGDEWKSIMDSYVVSPATVDGIHGAVIFPETAGQVDDLKAKLTSMGVATSAFVDFNSTYAATHQTSIRYTNCNLTAEQLEQLNAVFLPAAKSYIYVNRSGTADVGAYWLATKNANFCFDGKTGSSKSYLFGTYGNAVKNYAMSVRLVKRVD